MPIADRKSAVLRTAQRCPKPQLRAFVSHYLTVRGIGPCRCESSWGDALVRRGWLHPNGRLTADGSIVGKAYMNQDLGQ